MAKAKFTQFGMYPRLFIKDKSTVIPIIEKYYGQPVKDLKQGQIIRIYFNLLRSDTSFRGEVDALISAKGSKLYTIQQRVMGKKAQMKVRKEKPIEQVATDALSNSNFVNADGVTTEDVETWDEATFMEAINYEEGEETISKGLKIAGIALLVYGVWYAYKHFVK